MKYKVIKVEVVQENHTDICSYNIHLDNGVVLEGYSANFHHAMRSLNHELKLLKDGKIRQYYSRVVKNAVRLVKK